VLLRHLHSVAVVGGKIEIAPRDTVESGDAIEFFLFQYRQDVPAERFGSRVVAAAGNRNDFNGKPRSIRIIRTLLFSGENGDFMTAECGTLSHAEHIFFQSAVGKIFE
jgi:hypothetical protein